MKKKLRVIGLYLLERAKESSTWRGLTLIATGCGALLSPEQQEAIVVGGLMLSGLVGTIFPDKRRKKVEGPMP